MIMSSFYKRKFQFKLFFFLLVIMSFYRYIYLCQSENIIKFSRKKEEIEFNFFFVIAEVFYLMTEVFFSTFFFLKT